MAKQITLSQLRQASEKAKQYVDAQATAQVIRTETVLYSAPDTSRPNIITLSAPATDFDELLVEVVIASGTTVGEGTQSTILYKVPDLIAGKTNMGNAFYSNNTAWLIWYVYTNPTTLTYLTYSGNMYINKIYGTKFTVPETYSTSEQIVGTWIDGRPLYQKTITATATNALNTWQAFPYNVSNVDSVVDFTGLRFNPNSGETYDVNYYHNSGGVNVTTAGTVDRTNIYFKTSVDNSGQTLIYTLKYTKTT